MSPPDGPPAPPEARVTLERDTRLSESLIWPLQREFYRRRGTEAWTSGELPFYVTSNAFIARAYTRMLAGWLRDLLAAGRLDRAQPVYVMELAAGSGHFAFLFLKKLQSLLQETPALSGLDLRYVMTDLPEANLAAWQANERFQPFLASGRLDFAAFDLERDTEVRLRREGVVLGPGSVANPLAVLELRLRLHQPGPVLRERRDAVRGAHHGALEPGRAGWERSTDPRPADRPVHAARGRGAVLRRAGPRRPVAGIR